jgi:4-hydroxy-2-oxoheptanedioate aldolase
MGVKHFCIGWDVRVLYDWWRVNGEGMRAMLTGAPAAATAQSAQPRQTVGTY